MDAMILADTLQASHAVSEYFRRTHYSGAEYNVPTHSWAVYMGGRIVAWADTPREARGRLAELAGE